MWDRHLYDKLYRLKQMAKEGGGTDRIQKQHSEGKLTARERLHLLFDDGSFTEIGGLVEARHASLERVHKNIPGDGVITG